MAFKHGKGTTVLFNGYDLSGYLTATDLSVDADTSDTTTYGKGWKTGITGLLDATVGFAGLYDGASGAAPDVIRGQTGTDAGVLTYCPGGGAAVGDRARLVSVTGTTYAESSPVADVVSFAWDVKSEAVVSFGDVLHPLGATVGSAINGGFETNASGWSASNGGSIARSTSEANSGSASARVTANAASGDSGAQYAITGTFLTGRTYRLTVYMKSISGDTSWYAQLGDGADNNYTTTTVSAAAFGAVVVDWTPAADRTAVAAKVHHIPASAGVVAIDDVSVELLDVARDDGAATSTGWTAHLHITSVTSAVVGTFQLEDSANGTSWTVVSGGKFPTNGGTTIGARLVSSSATATLRRYVRAVPVDQTWVGATLWGPVTYAVAYSRTGS